MSASLVACPECAVLHRRRPLSPGEKARCIRCGAVLYRHPRLRPEQLLALVTAAMILFVIANVSPIVELRVQGARSSATLFGSILALWSDGQPLVALLVGATTLLFPLVDLLALAALVLASRRGGRRLAPLWRLVQAVRPWGMIEVFMLGLLVGLIKLSHLARVVPGPALWAFAALTVLLAVILSFDPRSLWNEAAQARSAVQGMAAARKANSLSRSCAFLSAAALLYIPANLLPVMDSASMFGAEKDTILSGIVYFWTSGSQGLAALIFFVSILVPMLKMAALACLAWSVHRRWPGLRHQRALLFRIVELVGRWSMLDVFVVALMVGLVRFRGLAEIDAGPGAAAFGAVVVLTMLASRSFDPRLIWDSAEDAHD